MGSLAQVGLALATSIGAWINFLLVLFLARRAGFVGADAELRASLGKLTVAGVALALVLLLAAPAVTALLSSLPRFRNESELLALAALGGVVYGALAIALFGRRWLALLRARGTTPLAPGAVEGTPRLP
jgi:putative peptidoglycan lipid II flippase